MVENTPKRLLSDEMDNSCQGDWKESTCELRPIWKETKEEERSNQDMSIDLALLAADGPRTIMNTLDEPNLTKLIEVIKRELQLLEGCKIWSMVTEEKRPRESLGLQICLRRSSDRRFGRRKRKKDEKAAITIYSHIDFAGD